MNKSLFSTMGNKLRQLSFAVVALAATSVGHAQSYVTFNNATAGANSLSGTFSGGTTNVTFTGGTMVSPSGQFRSPAIDYSTNPASVNNVSSDQTFSTSFADIYSSAGQYKNVTFTFSTPVIINELNIADIDQNTSGIGNWNDNFQFSGVTFSNVVNVNANAVTTGSGATTQYQANSINAEYARFQTSTAAVSSFTITFIPVGGLSTAYLQYSMKVTPAPLTATQPTTQNISNNCPTNSVNLNDAVTNASSTPTNAVIRFFEYPNYPSFIPSNEITGTNIANYATAGTVEAIYYYPGTNTWEGNYGSFFNVSITNPCPTTAIITGNIFHDNNGNTDGAVNGLPLNTVSGLPLYVVLVRVSDNVVVSTSSVSSNGVYTLTGVQNVNYTAIVSTNNPIPGDVAGVNFFQGTLPAGWVYTGEQWPFPGFPPLAGDGVFGLWSNVTYDYGYNIGLERRPVLDSINTTITQPTGGAIPQSNITAAVSGSDPDGTNPNATNEVLGNNHAYILSNPTNGRMYYDGTEVLAGGLPVVSFNPALISFTNLTNGSTSTTFTYSYTDAAGEATSGTYTIQWGTPLPLDLLNFSANAKNCGITLNWSTVNEVNVNRFEIEMSNDTKDFKTIGASIAKNNSGNKNEYSFNNIQNENTAYYRLKMIDNDGFYSYSPVAKVNTSCNTITLQPTLTNDIVMIKGLSGGETIQVLSVDGKVVTTLTAPNQAIQIHLAQFPSGQYLILVSKNNTVIHTGKVSKI